MGGRQRQQPCPGRHRRHLPRARPQAVDSRPSRRTTRFGATGEREFYGQQRRYAGDTGVCLVGPRVPVERSIPGRERSSRRRFPASRRTRGRPGLHTELLVCAAGRHRGALLPDRVHRFERGGFWQRRGGAHRGGKGRVNERRRSGVPRRGQQHDYPGHGHRAESSPRSEGHQRQGAGTHPARATAVTDLHRHEHRRCRCAQRAVDLDRSDLPIGRSVPRHQGRPLHPGGATQGRACRRRAVHGDARARSSA